MKTKSILFFAVLFVAFMLFVTCKKNEFKNLDCSSIDSKYSTSISGIISSSCTSSGCHNGTSSFDLRTYSLVKPYIYNGKFNDEVINKKSMPKGKSLTQDDLNKIKCWLGQGGPNN